MLSFSALANISDSVEILTGSAPLPLEGDSTAGVGLLALGSFSGVSQSSVRRILLYGEMFQICILYWIWLLRMHIIGSSIHWTRVIEASRGGRTAVMRPTGLGGRIRITIQS